VLVAQLLAMLCGLMVVVAPPAGATTVGVNGAIAFFRQGSSGDTAIYSKEGGGSPTKLVDVLNWVDGIAWSPNGTRIAYDPQGGFQGLIDVADADGGNPHHVVAIDDASAQWPSWSHDGSRILFTKVTFPDPFDRREDLWVVNANGSNLHAMVSTPSFDEEEPAWSPDDSRIAFDSPDPNTGQPFLYVMNSDGTGRRLIAEGGSPSWSPDGSRIAFADGDLFTIRPDGTGLHRVTYLFGVHDQSASQPAWSPDGSALVFQYARISGGRVDTVRLDGSDPVPLSGADGGKVPDWQPVPRPGGTGDLSVTQHVASRPFLTNQDVTFTVTIRNLGPAAASNPALTDSPPAGATVKSATGPGLQCSGSTPVTCTAASLGPGATLTLTLVVRSAHAGILRNVATADSSTGDPISSNDSAAALAAVRPPGPHAPTDFDGDGRPDLAVFSAEGLYGSTAVTVARGTGQALDLAHTAYASDIYPYSWGWASATGDFDGDGFTDLAGGASQGYRGHTSVGAVGVLYGSAAGLNRDRWQYMDEATPGIAATPRQFEGFGNAVAAGDFNGDGRDDLAVAAFEESNPHALGAVFVIPGSPSGLLPSKAKEFSGATPGMPHGDASYFGFSLAAADFDLDHHDDLAIGTLTGGADPGAVFVLRGSSTGLTTKGSRRIDEDTPGVPSTLGANESFGVSLAAGNFGRTAHPDLAVGASGENGGRGAVFVLFGSGAGLTGTGAQEFTEHTAGVAGADTRNASFGLGLAAGNLNGTGQDDLAVEVPYDGSGAVTTLSGGPHGLRAAGSRQFKAGVGGVPGPGGKDAEFGLRMAVIDVGKGGQDDLVVGAPYQKVGTQEGAGTVTILYGSPSGATAQGAVRYTAAGLGVPVGVQFDGSFGIGLA
jgi:uncharacterized repeat protein (TIGR01451 family)